MSGFRSPGRMTPELFLRRFENHGRNAPSELQFSVGIPIIREWIRLRSQPTVFMESLPDRHPLPQEVEAVEAVAAASRQAVQETAGTDPSSLVAILFRKRQPLGVPHLVAVNMEEDGHPFQRHHHEHGFLIRTDSLIAGVAVSPVA